MSASPVAQTAELFLTVLSGPDKGSIYKIVSKTVRIGRAADCDVVLKDPRCSRNHATIEIRPDGISVQDNGSQNGIEVDGNVTRQAPLKSGSHISLGGTVLQFDIRSTVPARTSNQLATTSKGTPAPGVFGQAPAPGSRPAPTSKKNFYIILGVVVLGVVFLFSDNPLKRKEIPIRTDTLIDEDIKASEERKEALKKSLLKRGVDTEEYRQTQGLYQQGFRDYREGNYQRAILALESVLALQPDHELARKYRDLARRRLDELIQLTMLEAKRYMEQNKYQLAKASYSQVLILIPDKKSKLYEEALSYYRECDLLLKGAY